MLYQNKYYIKDYFDFKPKLKDVQISETYFYQDNNFLVWMENLETTILSKIKCDIPILYRYVDDCIPGDSVEYMSLT